MGLTEVMTSLFLWLNSNFQTYILGLWEGHASHSSKMLVATSDMWS